jgi:hypothetical protein
VAAKKTPKKAPKTARRAKTTAKPATAEAKPDSNATPEAPKKKSQPGQGVSSAAVNMGHVFGLRPRVRSAFRQEHFLNARRLLEGESYASVEEAARAVAEKALALSNDPKGKLGKARGR